MAAKCELVLEGTPPVDSIYLIGPNKQSLEENISLQRSNCNIFGLTDTALIPNKARVFLPSMFLQNEAGDPQFLNISNTTYSLSHYGKSFRKNQRRNILARTGERTFHLEF